MFSSIIPGTDEFKDSFLDLLLHETKKLKNSIVGSRIFLFSIIFLILTF